MYMCTGMVMKTKKQILTDDLLKKGHVHKDNCPLPEVCGNCSGHGTVIINSHALTHRDEYVQIMCPVCGGTGEK